jgi:hypothetical protein
MTAFRKITVNWDSMMKQTQRRTGKHAQLLENYGLQKLTWLPKTELMNYD